MGTSSMRESWRRLPYDVGGSERHFRQSDALVRLSSEPTLWWHSTERPTLILGAAQAGFDLAQCEAAGVLAVRRHTGGSALYAEAGVLGLDVMLPTGHRLVLLDVVETYRWLGEIWRRSLQALGVTGRLVSIEEARQASNPLPRDAPLRLACFGTLSPYEVSAQGRKLVGLAQVRRRNGVLLQSAIHQHFDAGRLAVLLGMESSHALREAAIGLDELGDVSIYEVMGAFEDTLQRELAVVLSPGQWSDVETAYVTASAQPIPSAPDGARS